LVIERIVGLVLILAGVVAVLLGLPPASWISVTFFLSGFLLIGLGIRELSIAARARRSGS
jgi:hypothetical protein